MPKWKEFRYAYKYHKKYSYSSEELEALHKATRLLSDDANAGPRIAKGPPKGPGGGPVSPGVYYCEIRIHRQEPFGLIWVGFESDEHRVLYSSDGKITGLSSATETFGVGDVVGCGITKEWSPRVFFTKNGQRVATVEAEKLLHKSCKPFSIAAHSSTKYSINHGNVRFEFDIEAFCDSAIRANRLARDLPPELFQKIIQHYFDDVLGIEDIEAIHHLSTVCLCCDKICRNSVRQQLSLTSHREMSTAVSLDLLSHTKELGTVEDTRDPWLHILFIRSHIGSALTQNWICDYHNCEPRSPPHTPIDLHIFIRYNRWDVLLKLELCRRRFKSWIQFAKLIFSLPHLEHLSISDVHWDSSPRVPPSWLRFQGRLRSFRCSNIVGPHLWLFIAGQHPTGKKHWGPALLADEIAVSAQIVEAAINDCALRLPVDRLDFQHQADASYRLTGFNCTNSTKAIELTLAPVDENHHRLLNIWVKDASPDLLVEIVSLSSVLPGFETPEIEKTLETPRPPPVSSEFPTLTLDPVGYKQRYVRHTHNLRPLSLESLLDEEAIVSHDEGNPSLEDLILFESSPILLQDLDSQLRRRQLLAKLRDRGAEVIWGTEIRAYTGPEVPPEEQPVWRKTPQWETQNKHGRKPTQMKGNMKRR